MTQCTFPRSPTVEDSQNIKANHNGLAFMLINYRTFLAPQKHIYLNQTSSLA